MTAVIAIIQARMGSTRLPGKVLLDVCGKTVLERVVERVRRAKTISRIVIAIPDGGGQEGIIQECGRIGVEVMSGSELDVLDRYYSIARRVGASHVARITSDCPLVDPALIDRVVQHYFKTGCDYISTGRIVTTFPDGLDTEVFNFSSLERACTEGVLPSEREHVTPYIWNHPELFRIEEVRNSMDFGALRWTVDESRDLDVVRAVFAHFREKEFGFEDILQYLQVHPEIVAMNSDIPNHAGYFRSLEEDKIAERGA